MKETLVRIQLKTNVICYGPAPDPEEEVEQHLTIRSDGQVWLSHYRYGSMNGKMPVRKEMFRVPAQNAAAILEAFAETCRNPEIMMNFVTDVGTWELALTDQDGTVSHFSGSAAGDYHYSALSDLTRRLLMRQDLFVLDGGRQS